MSMELLVCWVTGIIVGMLLMGVIVCILSSIGTLRIDTSNPEKDVWRLDIHDLDKISSKKYIIMQIDNDAKLSQE